jgi:nucleoside-diphosphate-sugar epimerase
MRVFVTGGTGAIGGQAVPALVAAGHTVTALARTEAKATTLKSLGATPVRVSLFDPPALAAAFEGHDAVVNLATAIPATSRSLRTGAWRDNQRVRTEGSAAVVAAAQTAGISGLVQESVVMIYPDRGSDWIDESVPPDRYPMASGNLAAEANIRQFADSGGNGVVLRFGWFYGPGAAHSEEMYAQARHHVGLVVGRAGSYVSSIHLDDAASAVVGALAVPASTYNVVDDEPLTKRAYADALAAATETSVVTGGPRLGDLEAGAVARAFGDATSIVSGGLACVVSALLLAGLLPDFRRQHTDDHPDATPNTEPRTTPA